MSALMEDSRRVGWWRRTCQALYRNPVIGPLVATQRRRRILVGGYALVLVAMPLVGWLVGELWMVGVVGVLYAVGALALGVATGGLFDKPMRTLDERQLHVRRSLLKEPYMTGVALGLAGGLVIALSIDVPDALSLGLFLFVFGLLFGLPTMIYAWSIPDLGQDDE